MDLEFTKMHGLGNDFVLFDFRESSHSLSRDQIIAVANRRFGIGCDQVLVLENPKRSGVDVHYRIFNADGGEVEQCGNGARCIAVYLRHHGFPDSEIIVAETKKELLQLTFNDDDQVKVNMGIPEFTPALIPLGVEKQSADYSISTSQGEITFNALSMGNPHAVLWIEDVDQAPVSDLGPEIQQNSMFPEGVNVGFAQIVDAGTIRLRVFERGAGETLACGSGACAAVVAGQYHHGLSASVNVKLRGGELNITREGEGQPVWMTGPATTVFTGKIEL